MVDSLFGSSVPPTTMSSTTSSSLRLGSRNRRRPKSALLTPLSHSYSSSSAGSSLSPFVLEPPLSLSPFVVSPSSSLSPILPLDPNPLSGGARTQQERNLSPFIFEPEQGEGTQKHHFLTDLSPEKDNEPIPNRRQGKKTSKSSIKGGAKSKLATPNDTAATAVCSSFLPSEAGFSSPPVLDSLSGGAKVVSSTRPKSGKSRNKSKRHSVHEMLQVARECSGRDPSDLQLSYGEFCLFSRELKSCYQNQPLKSPSLSKTPTESSSPSRIRRPDRNMSKSTPHYQVFLGGSCNPTTWRQDVAIPMLSKYGISYYNPQVSHWKAELLEKEYQAKRNASVLFFVFDSLTRNVASMVEAGYMAGRRRKLVLVIDNYSGPGQRINGEPISEAEYNELSEGLKMVHDLVERQGIPVFSEVNHALTCTAKIVHENISPQDLSIADKVQPVKYPHVQLGDKLLKLRDAFVNMNTSRISLADANVVFKVVTNRELTKDELLMIVQSKKGVNAQDINKSTDTPVQDFHLTFQEFCCVVAEFDNQPIESRRMWNLLTQSLISPIQKFVVSNGQGARDVYLGGSQGPRISWRENVAIPLLQKNGLSYHVPSPNSFAEGLPPVEANRLDNSKVLFFTITSNSRGVAQMALASYYIGLGYNVVLCLQKLTEGTVINGEELSKLAIDDYNRGRSYLEDQAIKERIPVFSDIEEAMECVVQKCKAR